MKQMFFLVNYKGHFGTKNSAVPYRSGLDKELIRNVIARSGFDAVLLKFSDVDFREMNFKNQFVVYTSSEDEGLFYKDYVEDILFGLQLQGAILIPEFKYFRAHHNKVFMEMLRDLLDLNDVKNIQSHYFGTIEELVDKIDDLSPVSVIKPAVGSMSAGVMLSTDSIDLIDRCRRISRTTNIKNEFIDYLRSLKRKGYVRESLHRNKFIVQNFIPGLQNDWKILVYGKKYYSLFRKVRDDDFRASGSGKLSYKMDIPEGVLNFAELVYNALDVPHISLDIGFKDGQAYLLEFQALHFGTKTIDASPFYHIRRGPQWEIVEGSSVVEEEYAQSLADFIERRYPSLIG